MAGNINPNPFTTRPEIDGTFGVVASTHWIATAVGMGVLERGGNAFDAAVATAFTLQVVEPHLNGPGGDVPVLLYDVRKGKPELICGQGPAPAGATIAHYKSEGLDMVPGTGLLAACIPGMFDSWMMLLRDYGTMKLADVLAPAIFYAQNGHPLVERANATIKTVEKMFRDYWPTSAAIYLKDGKPAETGTLFTNPTLAATYTRVLQEAESAGGDRVAQIEKARKVWSQGFVAEANDKFCRTQPVRDTSGSPHKGVLTGQDMAKWKAGLETPLTYDYGRYTVCKAPWSQGPVMLQQLALLKGFNLDGLDVTGPDFIHLVVECSKLAYADREKFYGDPDFVEVPFETLLSDAYNADRRKLVSHTASLELRPGSVEGFEARWRDGQDEAPAPSLGRPAWAAGEPTVGRWTWAKSSRRHRVHFDIDRPLAGNMVATTPSGGWLQSSPVIPGNSVSAWAPAARCSGSTEGHPASLAPGQAAANHAVADLGSARRRRLPRLGLARRRPAGSMDHAVLPAPRPREDEPAGGDRRAGLALGAFPDLVLAADIAARRGADREPRAEGFARRAVAARPHRRGRAGVVGRPPHGRVEGRQAAKGRRQSARHAGLRGGTLRLVAGMSSSVTNPIIVADNASKLFLDGAVVAFRQLSLSVNRDEILCIVGPSGCGKTTFLRCIAGLTELNTGSLTVNGKPVAGPPDGVAMVFQHFGLLPWKTVYDNAAFGLAMARASASTIKSRVEHKFSSWSGSPDSRSTIPISSPAACSSASA